MIKQKWITGILAVLLVFSFTSPIKAISYKDLTDDEFTAALMLLSPEMRSYGVKKTDELIATINKTKLKKGVVEFTTPNIEIERTDWTVHLLSSNRDVISRPVFLENTKKTFTTKFDSKKEMILTINLQLHGNNGRTLDQRELTWNPKTQSFTVKGQRQLLTEWFGENWGEWERQGLWYADWTDPSKIRKVTTPSDIKIPSKYFPSPTGTDVFKDIFGHWAKLDIIRGVRSGYIKGYSDGTFRPNEKITEEQFLALLVRSYAPTDYVAPSNPNTWSDGYYNYAMIKNYPISEKRNEAITRKAVAEILAGCDGVNYEGDDAITYLLGWGLAKGKVAGVVSVDSYRGDDYLTRAEALKFIDNAKKQGLRALKSRPTQKSLVSELPKLPAGIPGYFDEKGMLKEEYARSWALAAQKTLTFENNKFEGFLPDLPEGFEYHLSFFVMYDPKFKINPNNSADLNEGLYLKKGQSFSIPVEWDKVTSGSFNITISDTKNQSPQRVLTFTEYPSKKIIEKVEY